MQKEQADKLVDDLINAGFTVKQVSWADPGDPTMTMPGPGKGPWSNLTVGSLTTRHDQIKQLIEIVEKHGCVLQASSFVSQAGDLQILSEEEAANQFPAHHKPPILPGDAGIQLRDG